MGEHDISTIHVMYMYVMKVNGQTKLTAVQ